MLEDNQAIIAQKVSSMVKAFQAFEAAQMTIPPEIKEALEVLRRGEG